MPAPPIGPHATQHVALLHYAASFATERGSIGIALLLLRQYHKPVARYYALFLVDLAAILAPLITTRHARAASLPASAGLCAAAGRANRLAPGSRGRYIV